MRACIVRHMHSAVVMAVASVVRKNVTAELIAVTEVTKIMHCVVEVRMRAFQLDRH